MSSGLPPRILISKGQGADRHYKGQLEAGNMPRLKPVLMGSEAEIHVEIRLGLDEQLRRPVAELHISLELPLQCQRCMKSMQWQHQLTNRLLLLDEGAVAPQANSLDIFECEDGVLNTVSLIEEEILLALPIVPRHEADSECGRAVAGKAARTEPVTESNNPFATLAELKTKH